METLKEILELKVIIQGAIGSFIFWLVFEALKRIVNNSSTLMSKYNKKIRKENLLLEMAQSLIEVMPIDSILSLQARAICNHHALNRCIKGVIYFIFGSISILLIRELAVVAYMFSLFYFFRAHKAAHLVVETTPEQNKEWHQNRIDSLKKELDELNVDIA